MKKRFSEEQIIGFLREAEAGMPIKKAGRFDERIGPFLEGKVGLDETTHALYGDQPSRDAHRLAIYQRFCPELRIPKSDTQLIEFLVRHHLTMSRIAQKEDLSDADVIADFARLVGTPERLTSLYLLTVADIRGTGPRVWNAWKGKLLEDLYRLTLRALGGARPNLDAEIEARKQEAQHNLALHSALPGTERPLWDTLEGSYFARHDAADIAWHARALWRHVHTQVPIVRARASSVGDGLQVLVYTPDRPDLFARICGYFDSAGFSIQDAKIHTTRAGYALDTFQVVSVRVNS